MTKRAENTCGLMKGKGLGPGALGFCESFAANKSGQHTTQRSTDVDSRRNNITVDIIM